MPMQEIKQHYNILTLRVNINVWDIDADSQVWGYLEVGGEEAVGVGAGVARRGRDHLRHLGAAAAAGVNPDKQEMVTIVPRYRRFHIYDTMLNKHEP